MTSNLDAGDEPDRPTESRPPADFDATRLLVWSLLAIFATSVALLALFYWYVQPAKDTIPYEIAKALIQLGVVAVAATAVSILVFEYQRRRQNFDKDRETERLEARERMREQQRLDEIEKERQRQQTSYKDDLLKQIMQRVISSYNSVKTARRLLRGRGLTDKEGPRGRLDAPILTLRLRAYDEYIEYINNAQLEFEVLIDDIDISRDKIKCAPQMIDALSEMEKHLNQIMHEYEGRRGQYDEGVDAIEIVHLPMMDAFLKPTKLDQSFRDSVAKPLRFLLKNAREELSRAQSTEQA